MLTIKDLEAVREMFRKELKNLDYDLVQDKVRHYTLAAEIASYNELNSDSEVTMKTEIEVVSFGKELKGKRY